MLKSRVGYIHTATRPKLRPRLNSRLGKVVENSDGSKKKKKTLVEENLYECKFVDNFKKKYLFLFYKTRQNPLTHIVSVCFQRLRLNPLDNIHSFAIYLIIFSRQTYINISIFFFAS